MVTDEFWVDSWSLLKEFLYLGQSDNENDFYNVGFCLPIDLFPLDLNTVIYDDIQVIKLNISKSFDSLTFGCLSSFKK